MKKDIEQQRRDFRLSLDELITNIETCERLCPTETLMEMCETLAGIMKEQTEILIALQCMTSEKDWREIREKFRHALVGERFYSSHLDALCDMIRLAKHMREVSESKDELLETMKHLEQ